MLAHITATHAVMGAGRMGLAMIRRWLDAGLPPARLMAIEIGEANRSRLQALGIQTFSAADQLPSVPDMLWLAIKPQQFHAQIEAIHHAIRGRGILICSIMAGIPLAKLQALGAQHHYARVMPNTPVATGQGVCGLFAPELKAAQSDLLTQMLSPLGMIYPCRKEDDLHAITAISGSGPAYVYMFMHALKEAALRLGIDPSQAADLVRATLAGSLTLAEQTGQDFLSLADAVTSPAGTTEAARNVLDNALIELVAKAAIANAQRSRELAE